MNKGICSVTFRKKTPEEIIDLCVKNNLSAIEWGGDIHVPHGNTEEAKRVGELTRSAGLKTPSYGSYYRCNGADFEPVSASCEALGARVIRVWAGNKDGEEFSLPEYEALVKCVREAASVAKTRGQIIAFEHHYGTYCNTAENAVKLIEDVNMDNVRSYWQPAYWFKNRVGQEAEDERAISVLKKYIVGVHVYNWLGREKLPLLGGAAQWSKFSSLIGDSNYYLEFVKGDSDEQFEQDAKTLLEI